MSREFLSAEGLRLDGRRAHEIRRVECRLGVFPKVDGSAYLEQGNTKVLASVHGPREAKFRGDSQHDKAIIRVEYNMASFSTGERRQFSKRDRRFTERAALIRRTFESVVQLHLYPRSEICIAVQVLQTHGGELCVAINAVTLALVNAGIPLNSFLCACSAGLVDSTPLVDLNYVESTSGSPELIVAAQPETDEIVTSQLESKIPLEHLDSVLQLALAGCKLLHKSLSAAVESYSLSL